MFLAANQAFLYADQRLETASAVYSSGDGKYIGVMPGILDSSGTWVAYFDSMFNFNILIIIQAGVFT